MDTYVKVMVSPHTTYDDNYDMQFVQWYLYYIKYRFFN